MLKVAAPVLLTLMFRQIKYNAVIEEAWWEEDMKEKLKSQKV